MDGKKLILVLSTVIVIMLDLTRRFESEFFEVSNFHSGFILQHFDFTQVFTVFTSHYFSLDQKNTNSKKQKAFTIFANKIFSHFLIGGAFSKKFAHNK